MVRPGVRTVTVLAQRGSVPPAGQLLPGVVESTVSARILLPVSGVGTVNDPVTVAGCPGARAPVRTAPAVAGARGGAAGAAPGAPLEVASSRTPAGRPAAVAVGGGGGGGCGGSARCGPR